MSGSMATSAALTPTSARCAEAIYITWLATCKKFGAFFRWPDFFLEVSIPKFFKTFTAMILSAPNSFSGTTGNGSEIPPSTR